MLADDDVRCSSGRARPPPPNEEDEETKETTMATTTTTTTSLPGLELWSLEDMRIRGGGGE